MRVRIYKSITVSSHNEKVNKEIRNKFAHAILLFDKHRTVLNMEKLRLNQLNTLTI